MVLASVGLVLTLVGFGYGVQKFSTLGSNARDDVPTYNRAHAVLGCVATGGGVQQQQQKQLNVCYFIFENAHFMDRVYTPFYYSPVAVVDSVRADRQLFSSFSAAAAGCFFLFFPEYILSPVRETQLVRACVRSRVADK